MKKELTYQEFLNLSKKEFKNRPNSPLEIGLYVYNKCLHSNNFCYKYGIQFLPSIGECVNALQILKNTYKEVLQDDFLNFAIDGKTTPISNLFRILDLFEANDTPSLIVSQAVFAEITGLIIDNLTVLTYLGYDLEKIYLSWFEHEKWL